MSSRDGVQRSRGILRALNEDRLVHFVGVTVIVLVWLVIGVVAAYQRDYFKTDANNCATAGTIALTVVAGPLNYAGANPKVTNCNLPEPSQ